MLPENLFARSINVDRQEKIRNTTSRDIVVMESLNNIFYHKKDPVLGKRDDWRIDEGIILYKDKVYVPPDEDLRREIVRDHHDPPVMGHPGIQKTYELLTREYWWPGMRNFVTHFVRGCAICQSMKTNTHPTKPGLMPIPHGGNPRPFATITMDHIVDLPESEGFNGIQVVCDHDATKGVVLSPCTKNIDAMGAADLLQRDVYRCFGLPERIISDRGPQFASTAFREPHKLLGVKTSMSTAYHPQTDGGTERTNQTLEVAIRIYCAENPGSWAKMLPQFEFALNNRAHSVTGRSPFELLMGYHPDAIGRVHPSPKHPSTEQRLKELKETRDAALEAHDRAAAVMAQRQLGKTPPFKQGDQVWLEATNLRLPYPHRKLAPKREGPFKIVKVMGPITYKLQLPKRWKIHDVFHASLLTPFRSTKEHGPSYSYPPPDLIDEEEEYEVEAIINHRTTKRSGKQFLIKWKGMPTSENSWEPERHLKHAQTILKLYKKRHKLP